MNSHEFKEIVDYLENGSYPETIELSAQQLWNFKKKAATYTLSESDPKRVYEVRSFNFKLIKVKPAQPDISIRE